MAVVTTKPPVTSAGQQPVVVAVQPVVAVKTKLSDASWTVRNDLRCQVLMLTVNGIDTGLLTREFAESGLRRTGESAIASSGRESLSGKYVRLQCSFPDTPDEAGGDFTWYGYITADSTAGVWASDAIQTGSQSYSIVGIEYFLGRQQVDSAVVIDSRAGAAATDTIRIERGLTFNGGDPVATQRRVGQRGNKAHNLLAFRGALENDDKPRCIARAGATFTTAASSIVLKAGALVVMPEGDTSTPPAAPGSVPNSTPPIDGLENDVIYCVYTGSAWAIDNRAAVPWTADTMVDYLLANHGPEDDNGDPSPCVFKLSSGTGALLVDRRTYATAQRSVLELLNQIASPTRGCVWWGELVTPAEDAGLTDPEYRIHIASLAKEAIPLPDGGTFPANGNQVRVNTIGDPYVSRISIGSDLVGRYDKVLVFGAPITSTFTVSFADGTLTKDWYASTETGYREAAKDDPDYPTDEDEKKAANDRRRQELAFDSVYSSFRVPASWDGKVGDGSGLLTKIDAFPKLSDAGVVTGAYTVWPSAMEVRQTTALPIASRSGVRDEYEPPIVVFPTNNAATKWAMGHVLASHEVEGVDGKPASYRLVRGDGGLQVRLQSTAGVNHTLAGPEWETPSGGQPSPEPSDKAAQVDYLKMRLTITAQADARAQASYGEGSDEGRPVETLVIYAGDDYRLDYLAKGAITGVTAGALDVTAAGRILRDDRDQLRTLATTAWAWYQQPTRSLDLSFRRCFNGLLRGDLITEVGPATGGAVEPDVVNSVVASVTHRFGSQQTEVKTIASRPTVEGMA